MDNIQLLAFAITYFTNKGIAFAEITIGENGDNKGKVLMFETPDSHARTFVVADDYQGQPFLMEEEDQDEDECRFCGRAIYTNSTKCVCDDDEPQDDDHLYDGDRYETVQRAVGWRILGKDRW